MAQELQTQRLTCESCGATLSWRIVQDMTLGRRGGESTFFCPACRNRIVASVQSA